MATIFIKKTYNLLPFQKNAPPPHDEIPPPHEAQIPHQRANIKFVVMATSTIWPSF